LISNSLISFAIENVVVAAHNTRPP